MVILVKSSVERAKSSATAEIVRDADDVDFSVDDVHSALALAFNSFNSINVSPFCQFFSFYKM